MKEEIKKCNSKKCKNPYKPISKFNKDSRAKNGISPRCAECTRELQKNHYKNNKKEYKKKLKEKRKRFRNWTIDLKKKLKCEKCGDKRFYVLDFHHRNENEKVFGICAGVSRGFSKKRILEEIKKCDILCANCHRELHYIEKNNSLYALPLRTD